MSEEEITLKVLSLNCWGIPYVSKNRTARMDAIADKLINDEFDIVCLQEIWSILDFKMFKSRTQEQLPYSHYFYSGVVGSGVCVFSRYPILDVMFHRWSVNGYVHKIHHGDWFGGKGVGLCKVRVQNMDINVYIAHLHAEYDRENDEYTAHRVLQAFDTAQFIRMTKGGADAVILGGDLNTEPQDLAYRLICGIAGLHDSCSNNSTFIGTNECAKNSYTCSSLVNKMPNGKRIDYILYLGSNKFTVQVVDFYLPFPERVPQKNYSYSDHEAIMAHLKISKGENLTSNIDVRDSLKEAINICGLALKSVRRQRIWYLIFSLLLAIPLMYSMGLEYSSTSIGLSIGINIGRLLGTAVLCYSLFMSSIWNSVEKNALKAGHSAMEIHLNQLINNYERKNITSFYSIKSAKTK
ncbi:putative neutral sphingomyelinase isoform X2 [Leptopilina boulardi]|uniref:putative neutral sphingomyelinase isoform X2 n=1 Tax=Leptopilina boulardi TaxID=63433 RepID=UPI0021F537A5|nr:putative neutral sphingomyelinase isoform X2 [Leptopilina boulardi]